MLTLHLSLECQPLYGLNQSHDLVVRTATPNALAQISGLEILAALSRHIRGDWGNIGSEDTLANEAALKEGGSLYSRYCSKEKIDFWVITEADRSVTTVLLPEDY